MGQKPKARNPSKKVAESDKQKEQSARFIKAAREVGVDESGKEFEGAIGKVVSHNRSKE